MAEVAIIYRWGFRGYWGFENLDTLNNLNNLNFLILYLMNLPIDFQGEKISRGIFTDILDMSVNVSAEKSYELWVMSDK